MPYYRILMNCTKLAEVEVYAKSKEEIIEFFERNSYIDRDPEPEEYEDIAYCNSIEDLVEVSTTVDTYYDEPVIYEDLESITEISDCFMPYYDISLTIPCDVKVSTTVYAESEEEIKCFINKGYINRNATNIIEDIGNFYNAYDLVELANIVDIEPNAIGEQYIDFIEELN